MKKILIITTGGTIAMKYEENRGVVPADDLVKFLRTFKQLKHIADIDVQSFTNLPSPQMTPEKILELAKLLKHKLKKYDGVIITHGTDTLEESAYLMDLLLDTDKPVVFTAAMRSETELGLDGPRNIVGAVRVACDSQTKGEEVLLVMNDEIHHARDVVKTDTGKTNAFATPNLGILGIVDPDKIVYYRDAIKKEKIVTDKLEINIDLIKCIIGMDARQIECAIEHQAKAIVIETFGRGNVPKTIVPAIQQAIAEDILVVAVSRTYTGRVYPEYGYQGGGKHLQELGVVFGENIRGPKMRIKLMVLFGKYEKPEKVKEYLQDKEINEI